MVPATSGGIALTQISGLSIAVNITITEGASASGRVFIGSSGYPPVGPGSTDQQRVGFPIGTGVSGQTYTARIPIVNPALLSVSAENRMYNIC
jgi:hypothetical protein